MSGAVKSSSASKSPARKGVRKSSARLLTEDDTLDVDFDAVAAAKPTTQKRSRRETYASPLVKSSSAVKPSAARRMSTAATKIKKDSKTLTKVLGTGKDAQTVTIHKSVTIKRKNRSPVKKSTAGAKTPTGKKRTGKRKPIVKKIVKKVVIKKKRHAKPDVEEKEPDPIIIKKRRPGKRGAKKVIKHVVVKKKRAAQKQEEPEPEPVIQRVRKHRQHTQPKVVQNVITIVKRRINPETGKVETYEEQVTPEELEKQMKEAQERRAAQQAEAEAEENEENGDPEVVRVRKHRKKQVQQYVTVIKKRINADTGKEEEYEEKVAIDPSEDLNEITIKDTGDEPKKSGAKASGAKSPRKSGATKKVIKKTIIKKKNAAPAEPEEEPEPEIIRVRKKHEGKKKVVQQYVTVIKKRVNPDTGKEEEYEEKVAVDQTPTDSEDDSIVLKAAAAKKERRASMPAKSALAKSAKSSSAKAPKKAITRQQSMGNVQDLLKKAKKSSSSKKSGLAPISPMDSLLLGPSGGGGKHRRRRHPVEKIIEEIVIEEDEDGERRPVRKPRTIIEEYYSDGEPDEIIVKNINIFDSDDEEYNKKKRKRDVPLLLSKIDRSKKGPDEIIVDDFGVPQSVKNVLAASDFNIVPSTDNVKITDKDAQDAAIPPAFSDPKTGINGQKLIAQTRPDLVQAAALDAIAGAEQAKMPLDKYLDKAKVDPMMKQQILQYNGQRQGELRKLEKVPPPKKFARTFGVQSEA